jgi:hypothetical protein
MKIQRILIALTIVNAGMLIFSLARPRPVAADAVAPVLRGRALQIVDEQGRVRASITLFPADPKVKMPDGTTGYPETVLLRLINSKGAPNIKIAATEDGATLGLGGSTTSLKMINKDGKEQVIKP